MDQFLQEFGSPDSLIQTLLRWVFGPSSVAVVVFLIVTGFLGYRDAARSVVISIGKARRSYDHIRGSSQSSMGAIVLIHVTVAIAQIAWIYATYILGVFIAAIFDLQNQSRSVPESDVRLILRYHTTTSFVVTVIAILAVLASYARANSRRDDASISGFVFLFGGPMMIFSPFWLIGAAIIAISSASGSNNNVSDMNPSTIWLLLIAVLVAVSYFLLCRVVFDGPRMLSRMRERLATRPQYPSRY